MFQKLYFNSCKHKCQFLPFRRFPAFFGEDSGLIHSDISCMETESNVTECSLGHHSFRNLVPFVKVYRSMWHSISWQKRVRDLCYYMQAMHVCLHLTAHSYQSFKMQIQYTQWLCMVTDPPNGPQKMKNGLGTRLGGEWMVWVIPSVYVWKAILWKNMRLECWNTSLEDRY